MGYGLGIDLGTSFTRAATSRDGHPRMVPLGEQTVLAPSAIRVRADGRILLADDSDSDPAVSGDGSIGRDFKRRLGDPTPLIVGGQPHSAVSLMAAGLKQVFDSVRVLEESMPDRLTLTCPAVWGPYRREQFDEVPRRAGIPPELVTVITEPEAAALHYAARRKLADGDIVAVYDLGGGTFDTAITRVGGGRAEILGAPEGVEWLGGVDFDDAVMGFVDRAVGGAVSALQLDDPSMAIALRRLRRECVAAKERLSRDDSTQIPVLLPRAYHRVPISRVEFENLIRTPLEATVEAVGRALKSTGLSGSDLAGVLLVGGSSRIPLVAEMLGEALGRPVMVEPHPQHCVALGAAARADPAQRRPPGPAPSARAGTGDGAGTKKHRGRRKLVAGVVVTGLVVAGAALATRPHIFDRSDPGGAGLPTPTPSRGAVVAGAATLRATATIGGVGRRPQGIVVSPDGRRAYVPAVVSNTLAVLDLATGDVVRTIRMPTAPQYLAVNPDGTRLYVTLNDPDAEVNDVQVVDAVSGTLLNRIPVGRTPYIPAVSPDGKWLYVPDHDSSRIVVVELHTQRVVRRITAPEAPHDLAFTPDGRFLFSADHESGVVTQIDTATAETVRGIGSGPSPLALALAPDGSRLAIANYDDRSISLVDVEKGRTTAKVTVGQHPIDVAFAADGRHVYVVNGGSDSVGVVDPVSARVTSTVDVGREPWAVAVAPRGDRAYVTNAGDDTVTVLDADG